MSRVELPSHNVVSLEPLKLEFKRRIQEGKGVFSPLELYLHPEWQRLFDPQNTIYVTAAASSGGYRAYIDTWAEGGSSFWKPDGHKQHTIIGMNTHLIHHMVKESAIPSELSNKSFVIPHEIGTQIPSPYGTLMGRNEADLMIHWMMRLGGVSKKVAEKYYSTMMQDHGNTREIIGNPTILKAEKLPYYIDIIRTFLQTVRESDDKMEPVSAVILGLDWKHSLGSQLEAAVAYILNIPIYEMALDENHPRSKEFIESFLLKRIQNSIHLPRTNSAGNSLFNVIKRDPEYIESQIGTLVSNITSQV